MKNFPLAAFLSEHDVMHYNYRKDGRIHADSWLFVSVCVSKFENDHIIECSTIIMLLRVYLKLNCLNMILEITNRQTVGGM